MSKQINEYKYFDTPDGQDTIKKLWVATKSMAVVSLTVATADVLLYSHPKGYLSTLGRYAYICFPLLGMSTAFVMLKNSAANVRGKDDKLNWVIGALAAGGIFGAWRKSVTAGFTACSTLSGIAMLKKHALQNNWTLLDYETKIQEGGIRSVRHDFTLTAHRPGNWIREPTK